MQHDDLDSTMRQLQRILGKLAEEWRTTQSGETVHQYHAVMRRLLALGWSDSLDIDAELPTALMPQEYLQLWQNKNSDYLADRNHDEEGN